MSPPPQEERPMERPVSLASADLSCSIGMEGEAEEDEGSSKADWARVGDCGGAYSAAGSNTLDGLELELAETPQPQQQQQRQHRQQQQVAAGGDCCRPNGPPCQRREGGQMEQAGLLFTSRERLRIKDFSREVRAPMDVEQFVHQAELMLDMRQVSVEDIVEAMLERVVHNDRAPTSRLSEAKEVIFIPGSAMLLAQTIQGIIGSYRPQPDRPACASSISYDQSWLCALCSLAQISRRHMVVARFRQPTKMGLEASCVRLFALIVTPSKEKGTKNALETGRTFATMLADVSFRQGLLEARTELEFKSLMMTRAQQLSKASKALKNRHKYNLAGLPLSSSPLPPPPPLDTRRAGSKLDCVVAADLANSNNKNAPGGKDEGDDDDGVTTTKRRRRLFDKNPRASKLIELIAQSQKLEQQQRRQQQRDNQLGEINNKPIDVGADGGSRLAALCKHLELGKGLWADFRRRLQCYPSDFRDAFVGPPKTIQKTVATIWFLYFGILLPTIAFSALNSAQTHGHMGDLREAIIGQAVGGLGFALLGGQPLVIIMTTAPLCLYTKVIHQMCLDYGFHFPAMYAAVGLWNGFFLVLYSLFGFSRLMKWCTRSTEEIFALFIVIAFISDASKDLLKNLNKYYYTPACQTLAGANSTAAALVANATQLGAASQPLDVCRRETSLLFILLMLGTLWLATSLYRFNKTPYLEAGKRELLADYALPTAVIAMSFLGSYVFDDIYVEKFPPVLDIRFERAQIELLPFGGLLTSLGLGFTLSLLFFMDQNISAAMVNAPQNGLKKGCAYHFDLLVVGILNGFLALYGLPLMHGVLPHSPLHVRSLADIEERVEEGHLREVIVNVRETRVTGVVAHILVLASLLLIPYPIAYIPTAVLNGLFLYMAVTSLDGLQMFERILLLFTEQSKYPPNHYIRRCPQRKIHQFTMLQLLQLLVMCIFGFSSYNIVEMFFPVIILLMIPFRHKIVPLVINEKYLEALDGKH